MQRRECSHYFRGKNSSSGSFFISSKRFFLRNEARDDVGAVNTTSSFFPRMNPMPSLTAFSRNTFESRDRNFPKLINKAGYITPGLNRAVADRKRVAVHIAQCACSLCRFGAVIHNGNAGIDVDGPGITSCKECIHSGAVFNENPSRCGW